MRDSHPCAPERPPTTGGGTDDRRLLCDDSGAVDALVGAASGARPQLAPELSTELLDELRATTLRLVALDRLQGSPRVLRPAVVHARQVTRILAQTPEHSRLRPRLILAGGEVALLNALLAYDQVEFEAGERWARLATVMAHLAGADDLAVAALTQHARLRLLQGDTRSTLGLLRQLNGARPSAPGQAYLRGMEAVAHAADGRTYETVAALDRAEAALDQAGDRRPPWWIPVGPATGVVCFQTEAYLRLGKPELAFEALEARRASWPANLRRGLGELRLNLAVAAFGLGEAELACEHALESLETARATGSRRHLVQLHRLLRDLVPTAGNVAVQELQAQFDAADAHV